MIDHVEASCIAQINHFVNYFSFENNVATMPDTHTGKESAIGFTMPLSSTVILNVIQDAIRPTTIITGKIRPVPNLKASEGSDG